MARRGAVAAGQPIALVLFDAFDTLVTPRIAPYLQYAEEARKVGLNVDDAKVKNAFRSAFKEMAHAHPVYGLNTGLPSSDEWWLKLIEKVMLRSGVPQSELSAVGHRLGQSILRRFETSEAYSLAQGVPEVLDRLSSLHRTHSLNTTLAFNGLTLSMATNSDNRILKACKSLGLGQYLDLDVMHDDPGSSVAFSDAQHVEVRPRGLMPVRGPTLSYEVGFEKPDARFFHAAVRRAFPSNSSDGSLEDMCRRTLYVGDHFFEDYLGAKRAGLQAAWLQRQQAWPDALAKEDDELLGNADNEVCSSMMDIINIIENSWRESET